MPRAVSRLPWCSYMLGRARWRAVIVPRLIDPHDGRELAGICHIVQRLALNPDVANRNGKAC